MPKKQAKAPTPHHRTPTDWDRFSGVLITYDLREAREGKSLVPDDDEDRLSIWASPTEVQLDMEELGGYGHYAERKDELRRVFKAWARSGGPDPEAVYQAITEGQREEISAARLRWCIADRQWAQEGPVRVIRFLKGLRRNLQEAQAYLRKTGYAEPVEPLPGKGPHVPKLVSVIDDLLTRITDSDREADPDQPTYTPIEKDIILNLPPEAVAGPAKWPRAGRRAQPVTKTRRRLKALGVSPKHRETLLRVSGLLLPYSPPE